MWIRILLFVAVAAIALPPGAGAHRRADKTVRVFAVGNKHRIDDGVSYEAFRNKMSALMDRGFPDRQKYVQAGVDDVASHLRPADPRAPSRALAVFPEDAGLVASLIGTRGAVACSLSGIGDALS